MTTSVNDQGGGELDRMTENLAKIEDLVQRLVNAQAGKKAIDPSLQAPGQELMQKAMAASMAEMMTNPAKIVENQISYWGKSLTHFIEAQQAFSQGAFRAPEDHSPKDRRFSNPLWESHPYFNYIKQQYFAAAQAMRDTVEDLEGLSDRDRRRVSYFSDQIIDMFSPTNFLGTNPDALMKAVETEGESLVKGLENLVRDVEANNGDLLVTLSDEEAFEVGENLATTPGKVVFRNHLFELIQYTPRTEKQYRVPLIIFPPWINKFYILDLKEKNSFIKWVVEQGFTLFVVSWKNPDPSYRDTGMESYIEDGYLTAIKEVKRITDQEKVNVIGYCIAGTTLSLTLSLMEKRKDRSIKSATFFTTLTDFEDQGEIGVFLDNDFVDGIERECMETGMLDSFFMSRTFSFLRSNDLIYGPAIRSYMMGEAPPAFDLLYWNGDSTNLPAQMAIEYLRGLCQENRFARDGFELFGENLRLRDVKVPLCAIACETDHIAAWDTSYDGVRQMGSKNKTFILSQSGHVAGIVNPPSKRKYGHYTNDNIDQGSADWREGAEFHEGSWWPRWGEWLAKQSGKKIPARDPAKSDAKPLADAPGTYVKEVPNT